jgi:hypothetical protein
MQPEPIIEDDLSELDGIELPVQGETYLPEWRQVWRKAAMYVEVRMSFSCHRKRSLGLKWQSTPILGCL